MHIYGANSVRQGLLIQVLATVSVTVLLLVFKGQYAISSLVGGMIATLANAYLAWKVFRQPSEATPEKILASLYSAEVGKIILTVMLFTAAILMVRPLHTLVLIAMYFVVQIIPWLVSLFNNEPANSGE